MIVISRKTGEALSTTLLETKQRESAMMAIFSAFLDAHPEMVAQAMAEVTGCNSKEDKTT